MTYFSDPAIIFDSISRYIHRIFLRRQIHRYNVNSRDLNYFRLQRGPVIVPHGLSNLPLYFAHMYAHAMLFIIFRTYEISHMRRRSHCRFDNDIETI